MSESMEMNACGRDVSHQGHNWMLARTAFRCPGNISADPVNSPDHYRWLPVEVIEITEHLNFCLGNVIKYVLRADHKGKPTEDLKKARWYLDREIERRSVENP